MKTRAAAVAALLASLAILPARGAETSSLEVVPAGYRGMPIPLSGDQAAFVKKGDRVDVMVTFEAKLKNEVKEKVTATILQDVLVFDVIKPAKLEDKGVIDLILNPNEAQYLALSLQQGELRLSVRAPGDKEMHPMEMASFRKLFR
jgi:Flp pilus assembly protein CpaB